VAELAVGRFDQTKPILRWMFAQKEFCGGRWLVAGWALRDLQVDPAQWGSETGEIGIGGDPFAPALDRDGGVDRIGNQLSLEGATLAEPAKNSPMAGSRANHTTALPRHESVEKSQCLPHGGWGIEDPRIGDNSQESVRNRF
jgi:hypothetical protein